MQPAPSMHHGSRDYIKPGPGKDPALKTMSDDANRRVPIPGVNYSEAKNCDMSWKQTARKNIESARKKPWFCASPLFVCPLSWKKRVVQRAFRVLVVGNVIPEISECEYVCELATQMCGGKEAKCGEGMKIRLWRGCIFSISTSLSKYETCPSWSHENCSRLPEYSKDLDKTHKAC